jgi:MATE family multidrug resistance protein
VASLEQPVAAEHPKTAGARVSRDPIRLQTELRDTLLLAGPIVINQVGHMFMGLVDTMVAGRIGVVAVAGLGLASNFFWTFTSVCVGCLLALDTWFSQAAGAGDEKSLRRYLTQSMWSCVMVTVIAALGILGGCMIYMWTTGPSAIREAFIGYVKMVSWCLPSLFFFFVLQRYWQARHRVVAFTVIIVAANILNLFGNLAFGLGMWGFPRMEVSGLALSTVLCRYAMLAAAAAFTLWELRPSSVRMPRVDWPTQKSIFHLGWPAAGHTALEIGAFTAATFMVGALGSTPLAAHHICLMMAAFTFMFPLGFSAAAAVRVGRFVGAGQPEHARVAGWLCIGLSLLTMSAFAGGYLLFPREIMRVFTSDQQVIDLGGKIFVLVALFQVADGAQVSTTGALRGLGNTRAAMIANLIGHYPIGLALGAGLCFGLGWGVVGMWWGLAAGLISVGTLVLWKWRGLTCDVSRIRPVAGEGES